MGLDVTQSFELLPSYLPKPQGDLTKITPLDVVADNSVKPFFNFVERGRRKPLDLQKAWWLGGRVVGPFSFPNSHLTMPSCLFVHHPQPSTFTLEQRTDPV